jgi:hypothetical protein
MELILQKFAPPGFGPPLGEALAHGGVAGEVKGDAAGGGWRRGIADDGRNGCSPASAGDDERAKYRGDGFSR